MDADQLPALREIWSRHASALVLYARQWCQAPEDVVQEVLVSLVTARQWPDDAVAWLYRAVRNRAISAGRSARRRQQHESAAALGRDWFEPPEGEELDAAAAVNALVALSPELREVVVARIWGGLTFDEIGRVVNCSSSAAHRRYVAGLAALRQRLHLPCPNSNPSPTS